jgi:hypothetical protein
MRPFTSSVVRRFQKSASPRPWDLPATISLEELAQGDEDLELKLGPSTRDIAAGGILDSATLNMLVRLRQPSSIFEIGIGFGRSTTLFAMHALGAEIFTLSLLKILGLGAFSSANHGRRAFANSKAIP